MDAIHLLNKLKVVQSLRQQQRSLPTVYFSQSTPEWETCPSDLCQMAERTHERRYSPVYPSVSLLCFPMSQSIFILSLCSPDDLQRRSLLIPSAPSLWSHYKPHIYLIERAACLLAWTAAGRSVCVWWVSVYASSVSAPTSMRVLYWYACICECEGSVYYLTWGRKMSECKMSPVTYSVSWLLRSRAGRTQSLFSFSLTCTLLPTNSLNTQNNKHTLVQS